MEQTTPASGRSLHVVAALSVAALFIVAGWKLGTPEATPLPPVLSQSAFEAREYLNETDADQDGLPDWKEHLLGTDPENADSDGDGVPDLLDEHDAALGLGMATTSGSTAPIDLISDRLVEGYLTMKDSGVYTPERGERLGEELASFVDYKTGFTPYTEEDVIVTDASSASLEAHRAAFQAALDPFLDIGTPEFVVYANYIESGDERALGELLRRADLYERAAKDVLDIPAPKDIALEHLEIANAMSFYAVVLDNLVAKVNDPIATLALLRMFNQSEQYVHNTFNVLAAHYRAKLFNTP